MNYINQLPLKNDLIWSLYHILKSYINSSVSRLSLPLYISIFLPCNTVPCLNYYSFIIILITWKFILSINFSFNCSSAILTALIFQMNFKISLLNFSKKLPLILFWNYIKFICEPEVNLDYYDTEFTTQGYSIYCHLEKSSFMPLSSNFFL